MNTLITQWLTTHIHTTDIILAMLGLIIFRIIHEKLTNKGPTLWPILGMIPSLLSHFHDIHDWNAIALRKSGGSYRIRGLFGGFEGIMTCDPVNIEYILKTKFKNFPKGEYYRERFMELLGDGIFNSDEDVWKEQRRIATLEMHTSRFMYYSLSTMQKLVHDKLLKVIEKQIQLSKDDSMDLQELLLRFTFDNVCMAAFGIDPGCLSLNLPNIPFAKAFEEATEYSLFRFLVPPFVWKTMRFFNLGKEKKLKEAVKIVHEFAETTVKNRKADINKPNNKNNLDNIDTCDLLSRLVKMQDYGGKNEYLSDKYLKDFCISFILAGRDTTSVALVWFFWLVHKYPRVETKILQEIEEILAQRNEGNTKESVLQGEELDKMVYLHATISESLRLYPSVPIDFKQARVDEVLPNGMRIKKGSRVLYHVYSMARFESIWGEDCNEFKPERWLNEDNNKFVSENQFKYAVFNGGPRLCVGKKFAYMQMKMLVASILLRYKVKVVDGQVIVPKVTTTLYMKHGMFVTFEPRNAA